jgi:hypothetical protein
MSKKTHWLETVNAIKIDLPLGKDDSDRNAKIEAALSAQGRKTVMPQEAHEVLHDWWHSKGKVSLPPEQQQRLSEIKSVKAKRANFHVVKSSQELDDLHKSLSYLKQAVESDLFKAKIERKEWSPGRQYSDRDMAAIQPHIDAGHSLQEAAHLSGVERTAQNHPHKISELSPAMRTKARAAAMDWIGKVKQREATEAKPEINPEKYRAGKAAEIHSSSKDVAKSYADALKQHKASVGHLSPEEQMASIQKFKADFHSAPAAVLAHADAAKAHADIAHSSREARRDELQEQRQAILGTTSGQPQIAEEPDVLDTSDMEDIEHGRS